MASEIQGEDEYVADVEGSIASATRLLEKTSFLTKLILEGATFKESNRDFFEALSKNRTLIALDLSSLTSDCNFSMEALLGRLADALRENIGVKKLCLQFCDLGRSGGALISLLRNNTSISDLDLSYNQIGKNALYYLRCALDGNDSLTKLDLSKNRICDERVEEIGEILRSNRALKELCLRQNDISDASVPVLASALRQNDALKILDLRGTLLMEDSVRTVVRWMQGNHSLVTFKVCGSTVLSYTTLTPRCVREGPTELALSLLNLAGDEVCQLVVPRESTIAELYDRAQQHVEWAWCVLLSSDGRVLTRNNQFKVIDVIEFPIVGDR